MKANGTADTKTVRFKPKPSKEGDRNRLIEAEARSLYATWKHTKLKVLTPARIEWIERMYRTGSVAIIRQYMEKMNNGELL